MITYLKTWLYNTFIYPYCKPIHEQLTNTEAQLKEQRRLTQKYEDLLANRNTDLVTSQKIHVTDHALHQYRKRIGFNGSNEELRKMIYKLTIRHLATMDHLQDGHYKINDKAAVRVKDSTVCTVVPATKRQS